MNCNMLDSSAVDALHKGDHAAGCCGIVFFGFFYGFSL